MIAKKNPRYNLEKKRKTFFTLGLMAAGSMALAAFTYDTPLLVKHEKERVAHENVIYQINDVQEQEDKVVNETKDVVVQDQKDQNTFSDDFDRNPNEFSDASDNTDKNVETGTSGEDPGIIFGDFKVDAGDVDEEIIEWPKIDAEFVGGFSEMQKFIAKNTRYPEIDIKMGNQGKVYLSFIVEKDGSITNIHIEKGVTKTLDREAKRIVRSFPKWRPAENDARKVRTRVRLPIVFVLEG